jgi:hypothetical protein
MLESQGDVSVKQNLAKSVTVVVCAYTRSRRLALRRAIDVALGQINCNDELIVIIDRNEALLARCREYLGDRASFGYFVRHCWTEGISKAEVSRRVGRSKALSTERHYVLRVPPRGIWDGLHDSASGDLWGMASSVAIVGLLATAGCCAGGVCRPSVSGRKAT